MQNPDVSVIIVSFNSASIIKKCLHNLIEENLFSTIIIDNASTDGSAQELASSYPFANTISLPKNIGYGRAANIGLQQISTPYALLLNPDIQISKEHIFELLKAAEKYSNGGIFAPAIKKKDHLLHGIEKRKWVVGAAMLFNMSALTDIGFFDENIFLFYEEKDLCQRMLNANKDIYLLTDIYAHHLKGKSSGASLKVEHLKNWHVGWSSMYFFRKHQMDTGKRSPYRIYFKYLVKSKLSFQSSKRNKFSSRLQGVHAFMKGAKAFSPNGNANQLNN